MNGVIPSDFSSGRYGQGRVASQSNEVRIRNDQKRSLVDMNGLVYGNIDKELTINRFENQDIITKLYIRSLPIEKLTPECKKDVILKGLLVIDDPAKKVIYVYKKTSELRFSGKLQDGREIETYWPDEDTVMAKIALQNGKDVRNAVFLQRRRIVLCNQQEFGDLIDQFNQAIAIMQLIREAEKAGRI